VLLQPTAKDHREPARTGEALDVVLYDGRPYEAAMP